MGRGDHKVQGAQGQRRIIRLMKKTCPSAKQQGTDDDTTLGPDGARTSLAKSAGTRPAFELIGNPCDNYLIFPQQNLGNNKAKSSAM